MNDLGKWLIGAGLIMIVAGAIIIAGRHLGLGHLPGDIVIERKNLTISFPVVTCIVISIILTVLFRLFGGGRS